MIVMWRGTNGSGKSYAMRQILKRKTTIVRHCDEGSLLIRLPQVVRPVLVIGPYTEGRSMGGCDCIRQPSKIYGLIEKAFDNKWHTLLEGVVLATKPYLDYHTDGFDVRYALFDPPFQSCLANIEARQRKKGQFVAVNQDTMRRKLERAREMFEKARMHNMIRRRFYESPIDATPWIFRQLRDET